MIGALAGLLLPAAAAWASIRAWIPQASRSALATAGIAVGGGIGLSALLTMWMIFRHVSPGRPFVAVDAILWAGVAAAAWRRRQLSVRPAPPKSQPPQSPALLDWVVRGVFVVVAAIAVATAVTEYRVAPHGQWDAWAIWNQKARFLFRGGDYWTNELLIDVSNPGHPLLVPGAVARLWAYAGGEVTIAPAMLDFALAAASVAVVMGALDLRRKRAWIAGAVLVAPPMFLHHAMAQQADVPVGFFIVATLALLRKEDPAGWMDTAERRATLLAAGVLTGLSAWTKNEGLVFLGIVAMLVSWLIYRYGRIRDIAWWLAGAAPAVLTVLWFKLHVAPVPPPYLDKDSGLSHVVRILLDPHRYGVVLPLLWARGAAWGGPLARGVVPAALIAAAVIATTPIGRPTRAILLAAVLMLSSYVAVYLLSPLDIAWLVNTSFDRVLAQLWPTLVLAAFSAGSREAAP